MLILSALSDGARHGYGIGERLRERSGGAFVVRDAALYKALRRLESRGWVESHWGLSGNNRKARFYRLTRRGRSQLRREADAFARYVDAVFRIVTPTMREA